MKTGSEHLKRKQVSIKLKVKKREWETRHVGVKKTKKNKTKKKKKKKKKKKQGKQSKKKTNMMKEDERTNKKE